MSGPRLNAHRLGLVLDRLASPFDGEKLAAIEAANRILRAGGATWRDLLAGLGKDDDAATTQRVDDGVGEGDEPVADTPHAKTIADLLRRPGVAALSAWEIDFLHGARHFPRLSPKQRRTLREITGKVARADA